MAWVFQATADKRKYAGNLENCPWTVGWVNPENRKKRLSKKFSTRKKAEAHARLIEGQLALGTYECTKRITWAKFRAEYEARLKAKRRRDSSIESAGYALDHFERIVAPGMVCDIRTKDIAKYVATRAAEHKRRGDKSSPLVSPATINRELRTIRAALRFAQRVDCIAKVPDFSDEFQDELEREPTYISSEQFTALYDGCAVATLPKGLPYSAADWWRALLIFGYMTGWRINQMLRLRRDKVDLKTGKAVSLAEDSKGKRDIPIYLDELVLEHLRGIPGFSVDMFPWPHGRNTLFEQFRRIQKAAGVRPEGAEALERDNAERIGQGLPPKPGKLWFGFHDLRRGFATVNAGNMPDDELQALMQHRDLQTTKRYVNMAERIRNTPSKVHRPEIRRAAVAN